VTAMMQKQPDLFLRTFHSSARSQNRERFKPPLDDCWKMFCDLLYFVKHAYKIEIHNFVMMPNHFHLLFSAPENNHSDALLYFMRESSRSLNRMSNQINHSWGQRVKSCEIHSHHYFLNAYKYIYLNPVVAGLAPRAEDYKYSTLGGLVGRDRLIIPVSEDTLLFENVQSALNWINHMPREKALIAMKKALRRKQFALPKIDHRQNPLTFELL
jgi:REP element-mobilizing transposase RayT